MTSILTDIAQGPDSPIHSLVWLAKDANINLPPIPAEYLEKLREVSPLCCYATDESLVPLTNRAALSDALVAGNWPKTGMALRLVPKGRSLYWQYILVGRVNILQVNLRFLLTDDLGPGRLALVSTANDHIQNYLQDEIVLARYLADGPRTPEETAHIILCENETAPRLTETHYTWSEARGLSQGRSDNQIFGAADARRKPEELIIYP